MAKFYAPAETVEDWRIRPQHRVEGRSAVRLHQAWQGARDFPTSVRSVLEGSRWFKNLEMLAGFPEHAVALNGQGGPSKTDLFVLARSRRGLVSIAVEGKAGEPFGRPVRVWRDGLLGSSRRRLAGICAHLELSTPEVKEIRYQLLHRTASALIEAERFYASEALMLVHSFHENDAGFEDYEAFIGLMNPDARPKINRIVSLGERRGIPLYAGWVSDV